MARDFGDQLEYVCMMTVMINVCFFSHHTYYLVYSWLGNTVTARIAMILHCESLLKQIDFFEPIDFRPNLSHILARFRTLGRRPYDVQGLNMDVLWEAGRLEASRIVSMILNMPGISITCLYVENSADY